MMPEPAGVVGATPVSVNFANTETPLVEAVAVSVPIAVGVAVVDAVPLEPVVAVALAKLRPVPVKLTLAPLTGFPFASFTKTTRGAAKAVPAAALCPDPETAVMLAAERVMFSVNGALALAALFESPE